MQGTVRKRGKSWQALITVRDSATGKRKQLSSTHRTKAEADRWLALTAGMYGTQSRAAHSMTIGELLDTFYERRAPDWSPSNRRFMRSAIDHKLKPRFGDTPVLNLHAADLDAWYDSLRRTMSPASIRKYHNILSAAFRMAERYDWVPFSPVARATPPRVPKAQIRVPTLEELLLLVDACEAHDPRLGFAVHLAAVTGARRGEVMALRWSDFDIERRTVRIWNAVVMGDGDKPVLRHGTKTGGERTLSLEPWTLERLAAYKAWSAAEAALVDARLADDGFLFAREPDGAEPMSPDLLSSMYEKARKTVGLDSLRLHDLRHYHATALLTAGVDVATVAGRLGHATGGRMTLEVYAHYIEPADRRAAEVVVRQLRRDSNQN
jgi:integrase